MAETHMIKLVFIFGIIVMVLWLKKPLYMSIISGIIMTILLYQIDFSIILKTISYTITNWSSLSILVILYLITFLQRILEARKQIFYAQKDLDNIFHNRRVNATVTSLFIGLLPSAAAMILCGDIVRESTDGYLDRKEQAFVTSWFRHIPESALPTYPNVLLMCSLTGVAVSQFMMGMMIPMLLLFLLGYIPYIRKLPKMSQSKTNKNKMKNMLNLFKHLWTLFGILILILVFNFSVIHSVLLIIVLSIIVYKLNWIELQPVFRSAIEKNLLLNTFLVLLLKEFISLTGVLEALPVVLGKLPIPMYLIFALLFFIGGIISGTNGIIALGTPIAFAAIPHAGMPLMVLLMCMSHIASQISPTHVCLVVAIEYFDVSLGDLIKKTLPIIFIFAVIIVFYYQFLLLVC